VSDDLKKTLIDTAVEAFNKGYNLERNQADTFVVRSDQFNKAIADAIQVGKDAATENLKTRLEILRDISPIGSPVSLAITKWIHELD
jgi:hypothetical protein